MDKQNSAGRYDYRARFDDGVGSANRLREDYLERHSAPGKIDRPFTRRMQQEAQRLAQEPASEPKKKKPKLSKKRARNPERRRFSWKYLLAGAVVLIIIALLAVMIFGERGVYHAMPTITPPETEAETIGG